MKYTEKIFSVGLFERIPERISEKNLQRISQRILEQISNHISKKNFERISKTIVSSEIH